MNAYTGETQIEFGGKKYTLCFDWRALAAIQSKHGDAFSKLTGTPNPALIADILEAGLQKHHKGITADEIMDLSPPLLPVVEAIGSAVNAAYFGADKAEAGEVEQTEKKT